MKKQSNLFTRTWDRWGRLWRRRQITRRLEDFLALIVGLLILYCLITFLLALLVQIFLPEPLAILAIELISILNMLLLGVYFTRGVDSLNQEFHLDRLEEILERLEGASNSKEIQALTAALEDVKRSL